MKLGVNVGKNYLQIDAMCEGVPDTRKETFELQEENEEPEKFWTLLFKHLCKNLLSAEVCIILLTRGKYLKFCLPPKC